MQQSVAGTGRGRHKGLSKVNYNRYGYYFVAPFIIVFLIFQLYPIVFTFRTSLSDAIGWGKINSSKIIGFDNFRLYMDPASPVYWDFWNSFGNTLLIWIANFIPQILLALLLASWFTDSRMRLRFRGGFKMLIFMPNIITAATIAVLFYSIFSYPIAPANSLLQQLGILHAPFEFFRSTTASRTIISFVQWWMWYGNTMIIMIAGIMGISPELYEAALVDGCSSRQTFYRITLPLIKPILLFNLVTSMIGGLQMFDIPHLLTEGNPNKTTNTVARFIYQQAFTGSRNFNYASAASIILFIFIVIISLMLFWVLRDRDSARSLRRKAS
ncbi:MAG TPA: sugar ABC transporter permease [Clostridia bacterium]|jgi:multiple sugar transport system permease protein|nr:sugar ABC transporter permease [Clostridia bacterium]HPY43722.1 sugar ABC transporter permease [Clostridia bacterium]HQA97275.1 sugar ABC transporter permease [Clostridia bacterium]HQO55784.1 sugar ABC transporter permease [Clostridia bacterium]HUM60767.1 sugar ABC transporter permease [Clostridia bacterium]